MPFLYQDNKQVRDELKKMLIDKNKDKDSNGFEGITVSCNLPHFYKGDET